MEANKLEKKVIKYLLFLYNHEGPVKGLTKHCKDHNLADAYGTCIVNRNLVKGSKAVGWEYNSPVRPNIHTARVIIKDVSIYNKGANERSKLKQHLKELNDSVERELNSEEKSFLKMGTIMYPEEAGYEPKKHYDSVIAEGLAELAQQEYPMTPDECYKETPEKEAVKPESKPWWKFW